MTDPTEAGMRDRARRQGISLPDRPAQPPETGAPDRHSPPLRRSLHFPAWIPFALSVIALVVQESGVALHAVPQSTPIAVALIVLTALSAIIAGVQVLIVQYQHGQAQLMRLNALLGAQERARR